MLGKSRRALKPTVLVAWVPYILYGCASDSGARAETESDTVKSAIVEKDREISREIDKIAEKIDLYVANRKYVDTENKSRLVIRNGFTIGEGGERKYKPQLGVKLHLPNLQEKLQLQFTSYDEDAEERGINENRYRAPAEDSVYGSSLALFQDLGKVKTEFRPRVDFVGSAVTTSYLFKFWSTARRGAFSFEPEAQLFARSDTGTGEFVALGVAFQVTPADELKVINEEQYTDGDNTLSTNHGLKWIHDYDLDISHENMLVFESDNRSKYHLHQAIFSSSLRHRLWRNVLHYSVTPYWTFAKEKAFHPATALDLGLEFIF